MSIEIHEFEVRSMVRMALDAKKRAYAPYSGFHVGACVKAGSGAYYMGCNIENAAFTPTICAERVAIYKAVYEGERNLEAMALVWDGDRFAVPCGVCRQVMAEFCPPDMPVICAKSDGTYKIVTLNELLPMAFMPEDLK